MEKAFAFSPRGAPPPRSARHRIQWGLLFCAFLVAYCVRFGWFFDTHSSAVQLDKDAIVGQCAHLSVKPGPPETFSQRVVSDRHQEGTRPIFIRNATIWTGRVQGFEVLQGDLLLAHGLIKAVGDIDEGMLSTLSDVETVDVHGAWVTPGVVDLHSHLAVESSPSLRGSSDGNSFNGLVLPWLRSLDALNTHDDGFKHTMAGGVTTSLILPGSADAIGGQAFVIKLRPTTERTPTSMLLEPPFNLNGSAADTSVPPRWRHMKHACGENPARVYSGTRMDTVWGYRQAYNKAREIRDAQDQYCAKALAGDWKALEGQAFPEDLQWESLVDVLRGRVKVQTHCYEAVDFDDFVRLSNEFQFSVAAFHHAHEAYLVPDVLKRAYGNTPAIAMFATFSRYKREAFRHSEYAPRILAENDIPVIMKSDHPGILSRFLVNEAAQAHYYGLDENIALASVISTPATLLGLDHRIGFLKTGYDADVVIWDSHPLALGATPSQVIVDGIPQFDETRAFAKLAAQQHAPQTPDFSEEAQKTLKYDGLPPLEPAESTDGIVIFTNITNVWAKSMDGTGIVSLLEPGEGSGIREPIVVVKGGKVVCSGASAACSQYTVHPEAVMVNLHGGALQPGLVSFGSTIGLQEISMEESTVDGVALDPLLAEVPAIAGGAGYFTRAVDGLQYGTRDAMLAYRHGVTVGITAPNHAAFLGGLSVAFSLGARHKLEKGAVVQDVAAVHVTIGRSMGLPSVSTQIATLRRYLLHPSGESGKWFEKVADGTVPLVVEVNSADIIATLIGLKKEVEAKIGSIIKLTIVGGAEAHLLAKELARANIGVILTPPRSYPYDWDRKRILGGPPLTEEGAVAYLIRHGVKVGLGPQGVNAAPDMSTWAVRNLRFDAGWALHSAQDVLDKASAYALASTNIEELLGIDIPAGTEDLVATAGGDLLGFEGKVVAVISSRRGKVDLF